MAIGAVALSLLAYWLVHRKREDLIAKVRESAARLSSRLGAH